MLAFLLLPAIWYLVLCIIIGEFGDDRKLGFWKAFLLSLLFSPLFGLLFVLASEYETNETAINYKSDSDKYSTTHKIIYGAFIVIILLMLLGITL